MSLPVYQCECGYVGVRPVAVIKKEFGKHAEEAPGCSKCGSWKITMLTQAELLKRKEKIAGKQMQLSFPAEG